MSDHLQKALDSIKKAKETNAEKLSLHGLKLTELPKEVFELTNLTRLDLSNTQLSTYPASISKLTNLTRLYLSNTQLSSLPESISKLTNLTELYLSFTQLSSLPESISKLTNLTRLYLSFTQLSSLPESISKLTNLTVLDLRETQLSSLPESISKLTNLTRLDLRETQLSSLPESISKLTNLTELYLRNTQLSSLPESISKLTNLKELDLSFTQLSSLPESSVKLTKLTWLDLRNTQLSSLPESISKLTNLTELYLSNTPIKSPPVEVANRGIDAIREYFERQKEEGTSKIYEAKLLVVGAGGVGKTSLSKKILDSQYELVPESEDISTEGIDIMKYEFKGKAGNDFRVNLWDFGGQAIYHHTHQFFLTKRSLYLLVTDSRKEDEDLPYWLNVQQLLTGDSPVFIIQNEKQGRVKNLREAEIRESFANVKGFLKTNLKDNTGLAEIVARVEAEVQLLPHIGNDLPKSWAAIRKELESLEVNYISLDKYFEICASNGIKEPDKALILSGYLHDIGVMLHFKEDPILERLVILNNEWGTDAVYKVIDYDEVITNNGQFVYSDLKDIWKEGQYAGKHLELIRLMERFKLCYKIPETEQYIAPARLPVDKVSYEWDGRDNTQFRYRYKFMPKGILTRFLVNMHHYIKDQKLMWNTGVVLEKEQTLAEVLEVYGKNEIRIRIKGAHPERLRPLVMERLDRINAGFTNLQVEKLIPCNCEICLADKENPPHFYAEEELLERKRYNKNEIECKRPPYKNATVSKMLNDYSMEAEGYFSVAMENAKALIGKGSMDDAFEILEEVNTEHFDSRTKDRLIAFRSRFNRLERQMLDNRISKEQYDLEYAKIVRGTLNLIGRMQFINPSGKLAGRFRDYREEEGDLVIAAEESAEEVKEPKTVVNVTVNNSTTSSETDTLEVSPKPRTLVHKLLDVIVVALALLTGYFSYQWVDASPKEWEPLVAGSSFVLTVVMSYAAWRSRR